MTLKQMTDDVGWSEKYSVTSTNFRNLWAAGQGCLDHFRHQLDLYFLNPALQRMSLITDIWKLRSNLDGSIVDITKNSGLFW